MIFLKNELQIMLSKTSRITKLSAHICFQKSSDLIRILRDISGLGALGLALSGIEEIIRESLDMIGSQYEETCLFSISMFPNSSTI